MQESNNYYEVGEYMNQGKSLDIYRDFYKDSMHQDMVLMLCVSGAHKGDKLLVSENTVVGENQILQDDFLKNHINDIEDLSGAGLVKIEDDEVFVIKASKHSRLIILGAGHVAKALVDIVKNLEFEVFVIDDRKELIDESERPENCDFICGDYKDIIAGLDERADDYYVCMTRGHRFDMECVRAILGRKHTYVGLMSSKFRAQKLRQDLVSEGYDIGKVNKIHSPIGLSIGAKSPYEIAVSVAGELIKHRYESGLAISIDDRIIGALDFTNCHKVICIIIDKRGSAPRLPGTTMVINEDGTIAGTIGGGIIEKNIIDKALDMINKAKEQGDAGARNDIVSEIVTQSVMAADVVDDGMLCGGKVTVYMELIRG